MTIRRVALIFDDIIRPDTTGIYCRRALAELVDVEHFRPTEMARIPRGIFDLYLNIDDGQRYRLPADLHPSAWWAIDTHLDLPWYEVKGADFDQVFTAQRDGAALLQQAGLQDTLWLPLACDPRTHHPVETVNRFDVAFVGHVFPGPREELLRLLRQYYPRSFVGQAFFEQMMEVYGATHVIFNRSLRNDVNMRVFEALGARGFLLTNDLSDNGQSELLRDGVHLATYGSAADLLDKLAWYLTHEEVRSRIAQTGRSHVLEGHTYAHRMRTILETMERIVARRTFGGTASETGSSPQASSCSVAWREQLGESPPSQLASDAPLVSVVVVTHNQFEYTRACLASLLRNSRHPFEVIVVDNGSTDGTVDYLADVSQVRLLVNSTNLGFPAAANQGIEASRGDVVVLLNNDCVVPRFWLDRLLAPFDEDAAVGLVGPCSNCVSGPQQVQVGYQHLGELESFVERWTEDHHGERQTTDRLVGFCLAIRRSVVAQIGRLDERFGIGNFEDDDYCLRAIDAGFRCVIARDAFVHHFGHRTFHAADVDLDGLLTRNAEKFRAKWGLRVSETTQVAHPSPPRPPVLKCRVAPDGNLLLAAEPVRLSLCMIVRNNEATLSTCLESIRPWVDELIVVDTGSADRTPELARRSGARVFHFPWCDDFSAARNESLTHAFGEWVFWMDSDDTISAENGQRLRELAYGPHNPNVFGYVMQVHCPGRGEDGDLDVTVVDHVKLFRNRTDLRFEGRIHEQILRPIRAAGGDVAWTDIHVVHSGSDQSAAGRRRKVERDLRILLAELQDQPNHPFVLFNLGMTYADAGDHGQAVDFFRRSLAISDPTESHVRKAYALLASSLFQLERWQESLEQCQTGLQVVGRDPELFFRSGLAHHQLGQHDDAIVAYQSALAGDTDVHFNSRDVGISGFKARHNLAVAMEDCGRYSDAESQWRAIVVEVPHYEAGWRGLLDNVRKQGAGARFEAEIAAAKRNPTGRRAALVLQGQLAKEEGSFDAARAQFEEAATLWPNDPVPKRLLAQLLFEHFDPQDASEVLSAVVTLAPEDAASYHNLAMCHLRLDRPQDAADSLQQSLTLRPLDASTRFYYGNALESLTRLEEAQDEWRRVLELDPESAFGRAARAKLFATLPSALPPPKGLPIVSRPSALTRFSLIIPVLDSHEVLRRQVLHLDRILTDRWEALILDDGSDPPLELPARLRNQFRVVPTGNKARWTQGLARNLGARLAQGDYLFLTDIDHILTIEALQAVESQCQDRIMFTRAFGVLDEGGGLRTEWSDLVAYGAETLQPECAVHPNTFGIRGSVFRDVLRGYNEELCGRGHYGGDDIEFNERYHRLVKNGDLTPDALGPQIYVFPEAANDPKHLFHSLSRD